MCRMLCGVGSGLLWLYMVSSLFSSFFFLSPSDRGGEKGPMLMFYIVELEEENSLARIARRDIDKGDVLRRMGRDVEQLWSDLS